MLCIDTEQTTSIPTNNHNPNPSKLGFKDLEALKKALVANLRDSAIWGITYLYVRV